MPGLLPNVDPDGLLEYSVVYTDRALNHMSESFQHVMNDISRQLKKVYNAAGVVVVPGSGTFGMEAVARQFATGKPALVVRNGWFSYRWSQIFEVGNIPDSETVLKASRITEVSNHSLQYDRRARIDNHGRPDRFRAACRDIGWNDPSGRIHRRY